MYNRENWTESYVQWSPHGSYLATLHRQGVAVWGTSKFTRIHRFAHSMVRFPAASSACVQGAGTHTMTPQKRSDCSS